MPCWSHQAKNAHGGAIIGHAGVLVADRGGEEFQEAARGLVAGGGDHARHDNAVARGDDHGLRLDDDDGLARRASRQRCGFVQRRQFLVGVGMVRLSETPSRRRNVIPSVTPASISNINLQ